MKKYLAKRNGRIGKRMVGALYVHKSAIDTLSIEERCLVDEKIQYIGEFTYDIIKINIKEREVSFTQSPDWDTAFEPSVGDRKTVKADNSVIDGKASTLIYHHKWMFVEDSYTGFDVKESKLRSEYWMNHPHVLKLKADKKEKFNLKIGRRDYWDNMVCSEIE